MMAHDPLLNAKEVAGMLRISIPSLYRRIGDGTIPPPIKLGHLSRWSQADIQAALNVCRRVANVRGQ
ncbi:helix-turn-helix domain-containing protein [Aliihoeflea sp. 2WW]|uniref:helix-turn-helix transcriptional regulator n=1 Tax=Aliihoeflea sp. 2WW TaxID=1381123 RepID=UPI0004659787|nr:helix-turn-helix domain-containing protein [Aliihoeflea sp. 2WW]